MTVMEKLWGTILGVLLGAVVLFIGTLMYFVLGAIFSHSPIFAIFCVAVMGVGGYVGGKHIFS